MIIIAIDQEGIIDEVAIDELLAVANKELFDPQSEAVPAANASIESSAGQEIEPTKTAVKNNLISAQILQQPHLKSKLLAIALLLCVCIASGGYLGYQTGQHTSASPLSLNKIIEQGITFEEKNLVTYAGRGDKDVVITFLDAGMDINAMRTTDGWTALTAASFYKRPELVKLLLEKQAIVDVQDTSGRTPLMYAAAMGTEEVVTLLLNAGAKPNIQDKKGRTALMEAYSKQEAKIAEILKSAGAVSNFPVTATIEERPTVPIKSTVKEQSLTSSTIPNEFRLTVGKAGLVHIGMTLEDLQKIYPSLILHGEYINGNKETTATIYLNNSSTPSLKVELSKGKTKLVSMINIDDARFSTDKDITMHSTVGDIRNQYPISDIRVIDNSLYLRVRSIKMLFELDISDISSIAWLESSNPDSISPDTKIKRVIVY
ncbi:MAG: Ankyrin repeat-containing protein [Pelosinus sp.]|nr:Ankyrin repeat-containing protein [Pelosinus sp.]